jgi:2-C-methyl-D-erythritol 4-phosphate cytidylyltransferase / 2-C-methyl-D-erythritol 2,4-cyclodiphosphate synthase
MLVTAIIAAGGRGQRFGGAQPKQFVAVGGRPILERSVGAFTAHPAISEVIVALPQELVGDPPPYLRGAGTRLRIVAGGARRQDSVANAFRAAAEESEVIVIHDAARPFASRDLISRTIAAAAESGAALAALGARDTVKRIAVPSPHGHPNVLETLPRETIYLAQTPQAFRREVLRDALALSGDASDEAALAERAGHQVRIVDGEATNIKVTTPEDLVIAEAIAWSAPDREGVRGVKPARTGRAGTGYDLHRLVPGRPLVIGGVTIPSDRGALGHSDADVVCHAVTDAILGAAGLGDIGRHFPDSDPQWKDASSLDLLARAVALVEGDGLQVGNVDVTVVLEAPKIREHVGAMRAAVARAIGIEPDRVSIKGKTNEGMDAVGRGEAIAAHAIALVRSR